MTDKIAKIVGLLCLLSGCSSMGGAGDDCQRLDVPERLQQTLQASCQGDQQASLALGKYYEAKAREIADQESYRAAVDFYQRAAASSSGQTFIYIPAAGDVPGYTMPVTTGPRTFGLAQAKYRLAILYYQGNGVRKNITKACNLFRQARAAGIETDQRFECSER